MASYYPMNYCDLDNRAAEKAGLVQWIASTLLPYLPCSSWYNFAAMYLGSGPVFPFACRRRLIINSEQVAIMPVIRWSAMAS